MSAQIVKQDPEWPTTHRYCFFCKKVTTFTLCENCGKMFCLGHAAEETDGDWESGYKKYRYHEACLK